MAATIKDGSIRQNGRNAEVTAIIDGEEKRLQISRSAIPGVTADDDDLAALVMANREAIECRISEEARTGWTGGINEVVGR